MVATTDPHTLEPLISGSAADATSPANAALIRNAFLARGYLLSASTTTPPVSPVDGDGYLIPSGATGVWAGQDGRLAHRVGGVWQYYQPRPGYGFLAADLGEVWIYENGTWGAFLRPDFAKIEKSGTYAPTAADFLNARLLSPAGNLTVQCDTVSLVTGFWYPITVIKEGGFSVDFANGSATLLRGNGLAITHAGDLVTLAVVGGGGSSMTVAGVIA